MSYLTARRSMPGKIVLVGTYLPRQCGIATFTSDLLTALAQENPEVECWAMVMNDTSEGYRYPPEVRFEVNQRALADYLWTHYGLEEYSAPPAQTAAGAVAEISTTVKGMPS